MKKTSQAIDLIRLVTLLVGAVSVPAYAQAPSFSAPPLPAIPGAPAAPAAPKPPAITLPTISTVPEAPKPETPAPVLSDLSTVKPLESETAKPTTTTPTGPALSDLPIPEATDVVATTPPASAPTDTATTNPLPNLPAPPVTLPGLTDKPADGGLLPPPPTVATLPSPPEAGGLAPPPFTIPTVNTQIGGETVIGEVAAPEEPKQKSWETTLETTVKPPKRGFNYRRALLPGAIYRAHYDYENSHLPKRVTREDYVRLLFASAAANNVNATRALLNAGTDMNAVNMQGESVLQVARRYGAEDTVSLLSARGAQ